jgi:PIN domain nuclease of toxin-antitoxin system
MFLWLISGDTRLPTDWRDRMRHPENAVCWSVVGIWEAMVQHCLGKWPLPHPPEHYLPAQRARRQIASLSLNEASVGQLATLPSVHRDPLDRMLVCQALEHGLTMVTVDPMFQAYPVPMLGRTEHSATPDCQKPRICLTPVSGSRWAWVFGGFTPPASRVGL